MTNKNEKNLSPLLKFLLPIVIGLGVMLIMGFLLGSEMSMKYWPLMTGYFFPPLGKESIIPLGIANNFHPAIMALSISFIDAIVALFLVWNYDLAKQIPIVGTFMKKVEEKGQDVEGKYGWIKPLRFVGIVLFVMVPFQGSGGMGGSIVGRLIGMKPWNTFLAIVIGALLGTFLIAYLSEAVYTVMVQNVLAGVLLLIIIIISGLIIYVYRESIKKNLNHVSSKKKQ
jgi:uncharacterized membrane protein